MANRTLQDSAAFLWDESEAGALSLTHRTNHVIVREAADLPAAVGGVHPLAADTLYEFNGTVTSANGLQYAAGSKVIGRHFGKDNFVYTGTAAALVASDVSFNLERIGIIAPNGAAFDVSGQITDELAINFCNIFGCSSLGTITGFRVPFAVKTNFENYTTGLTIAGTMDKLLIDSCPFRGAAAGAKSITFGPTFSAGIVDLTGGYFKDHGAGAVGVSFDAEAEVTDFGLFRGMSFSDVTTPVEGFGPTSIEWDFNGNAGVPNSRTLGAITMDANATATVLPVDEWVKVAGTTTSGYLERFDMPEDNRMRYTGRRSNEIVVSATATVLGSTNNQVVQFSIFKNGVIASPVMTSVLTGPGTARADAISITSLIPKTTGDYLEVWMRCASGSNNATVESLQVTVQG